MTISATVLKPAINVCLLQPPGYIHALALLEAAEYVTEKCCCAGYSAVLSKNRIAASGLNIIFGAHINPAKNPVFPPNTVIFNTEQIPEKSVWINTEYKQCLDRHFVWDYSNANLALLHDRTQRVDFFHVDRLSRITLSGQREFDLVFYGSMNPRRKAILEKLVSRGLKIQTIFGLYGAERDFHLGKARAVLNLHFYDAQIFQQIRAFYALSNSLPVISENFPEDSAPSLYRDVIFTPGSERFEDFAERLLGQNERFESESRTKIELFHASADNAEFDRILEKTADAVLSSNAVASPVRLLQVPERISLYGGQDYRPGYLNVASSPEANPDLVLDLSGPLNFPVSVKSPTYGNITLEKNSIKHIIAVDILSKVSQLPLLMSNCLRLLREGGQFTVVVPHELSLGAWQNPAHVRAFNENSWLYYTQRFWCLGWFEYCFDCTETNLDLSEHGKLLVGKGVSKDEVLRTPRAVNSMSVVLTKRKTTPEEKTLARAHSANFIGK